MLARMMVVAALMLRCGFTPVQEGRGPMSDAGAASATPDAGVVVWCAGDHADCWADGWDYETPGRCCGGRQTCKGLAPGVMGYCEY